MNDMISKVLRHPATVPAAVGLLSFGGGLAAGMFLGRRSTWKKARAITQDVVNEEVQAIKERHLKVVVDENHPAFKESKPEVTVEEYLQKQLENRRGSLTDEQAAVVQNVFTQKVFAQNDTDWNYDEEKRNRSSDTPYILHQDEFFADEMPGFTKKTLTYWVGDDTLADDNEVPIYNRDDVMGGDVNLRFGHGSGEEHVVYIRNELRREEYEILREEGLYAVEVMGADLPGGDEIQHSAPRRFPQQQE